jgi:hypothetical protein
VTGINGGNHRCNLGLDVVTLLGSAIDASTVCHRGGDQAQCDGSQVVTFIAVNVTQEATAYRRQRL